MQTLLRRRQGRRKNRFRADTKVSALAMFIRLIFQSPLSPPSAPPSRAAERPENPFHILGGSEYRLRQGFSVGENA